jgi:hypothetical protein
MTSTIAPEEGLLEMEASKETTGGATPLGVSASKLATGDWLKRATSQKKARGQEPRLVVRTFPFSLYHP